jgi:hypothetical protein
MEKPEFLKITYDKDKKVEEAEEKISDILSEAIYSYILRRNLLAKQVDKPKQT